MTPERAAELEKIVEIAEERAERAAEEYQEEQLEEILMAQPLDAEDKAYILERHAIQL